MLAGLHLPALLANMWPKSEIYKSSALGLANIDMRFSRISGRFGLRLATRRSYGTARRAFLAPKRFNWTVLGAIAGCGVVATIVGTKDCIKLDTNKQSGISVDELQKHDNVDDGVWVSINGLVYDLTDFLAMHPGGAKIIMHYAGKNASTIFNKFHAKDVFSKFLAPEKCLGPLIGDLEPAEDITVTEEEEELNQLREQLPKLSKIFNISDFEYLSKRILTPHAWAYYSSAADDEITLRENHYAFGRIFFNPKVLTDVSEMDISTEFLGVKTEAPFYCSAAAQARMGNEEGELSIARGCGNEGIIQMISSSASYSLKEIVEAARAHQPQWFQLYVNLDRDITYNTIKECEQLGVKAIFVTVDTVMLGRREKDLKLRLFEDEDESNANDNDAHSSDPLMNFKDVHLTWKDIDKFKSMTKLPIVLKGVQRVEDVLLAVDHGVDAVVLSNHGGRQLDYSRAPVEVLADVMPVLREKKLDDKIEVYIDGGIRRGTDILKALCLGAKGVGLGRPFLYANSTYGEEGVTRAIQMLKRELVLDMKLLGVSKLEELRPELLDLRGLHNRVPQRDMMYDAGYVPLAPPKFLNET